MSKGKRIRGERPEAEAFIGPKVPRANAATREMSWLRRHLAALLVVLAIIGISAGAAAILSGGPAAPSRVTGTLTTAGPVDVGIDSKPGKAISPVCGCYKVKHDKEWRGVSFAARSLQISGKDIPGGYIVSAANPEPATWEPGRLFFSAQLFTLESLRPLKGRPGFNARELLAGRAPSGWRLLAQRTLRSQESEYLRTEQPLNVKMLGPVPVGAWIPSGGSRVHLAFKQGLFPSQGVHGELMETERGPSGIGPLGVPLADVLGPNVVIWSRDPKLEFEAPGGKVRLPRSVEGRQKVTALLIRRPPFATRIAPMTVLPVPARLGGPGTLIHDPPKGGTYRVRLGGPPVTGDAYARVSSHLKAHEFITLKHLTEWGIAPRRSNGEPYEVKECKGGLCTIENPQPAVSHGWTMGFRYPPRPPAEDSFTVFGPLRYLRLHQAEGHVSSESRPLAAPTNVALRKVRLLGTAAAGALTIPAKEVRQEINFSASSSGTVDGHPLVTQHGTSFWSIFAPVMAALVGLCGLYVAIAYARRRREQELT